MAKIYDELDILPLLDRACALLPDHSVMQVLRVVNEFYFGRELEKRVITMRNDNELIDALKAWLRAYGR